MDTYKEQMQIFKANILNIWTMYKFLEDPSRALPGFLHTLHVI